MKKILKQLMYGDLVWVKPSMMPIRICAIHKNKVGYHSNINKLEWVWMNLLAPIPLTEEFFKNNGFEKKIYEACPNLPPHFELFANELKVVINPLKDCQIKRKDWLIQIMTDDKYEIPVVDCEIQYVHQFQNKFNDAEIEMEVVL